ncbi:MAG: homoserine dehydrogenase [Capsulimonadaceae bacterium]
MSKDKILVGVLGLGNVGSGTIHLLQDNAESIARKVGMPIEVAKVAVRDTTRARSVSLPAGVLTDNADEVVCDPEIDIVCELIGGLHPAYELVYRAITNGKHIVTANKEMMAKAGNALLVEAHRRSQDFNFEGSVGGGIPIIQPLKQALAANRFSTVMGIVNGTTNYILSRMTSEGADFGDVLTEAQAKGYAEADPSSDVGGLDAQYKTAILASIAFTSRVDLSKIHVEGITRITQRDIEVARDLGYVIKLLGIGQEAAGALQVRVHPTLLPAGHPLASVNDVYNAVYVRGDSVGDVMFYGRGAGSGPTGSAVVGDIIEIARNIRHGGTGRIGCTCFAQKPMLDIATLETKYYVRVLAQDRPKVLASLASILGDLDVSIASVVQRARPGGCAEIVWITHCALEANLRSALDIFARLAIVESVENCLRVEE